MATPASRPESNEFLKIQIAAGHGPKDPSDFTGIESIRLMTAEQYAEGCPKGSAIFIQECASTVFHGLDRGTDVRRYLNAQVKRKLVGGKAPPIGIENTVNHVLDQVAVIVNQARYLEQLATDEIGRERELVFTDDEVAYGVLQLLGTRPFSEKEMFKGNERELRAGLWTTLTMADPEFGYALHERIGIGRGVTTGGPYKKYFAQDMLHEAIDYNTGELPSEYARLREHLVIVRAVNDIDDNEAIQQMLRPEVLEKWPADLREFIRSACSNLMVDYSRNAGPRARYLAANMLAFYPPEQKRMDHATKDLANSLRKLQGKSPGRNPTKAQEVAAEYEARRAKSVSNVGRVAAKPEVEKPKNQLYVFANGEPHDERSDKFMAKVTEGIDGVYKGDPDLRKDMGTILEFLRDLDLSQGFVSGVKQLAGSAGTQFELKVSEASGLPTTSVNSKKIRIIFQMGQNGGIQIIRSAMRRDLHRILKRG